MSITHSSDDVVRAFQKEVAAKYHPEFAAGGYAQDDGTVEVTPSSLATVILIFARRIA